MSAILGAEEAIRAKLQLLDSPLRERGEDVLRRVVERPHMPDDERHSMTKQLISALFPGVHFVGENSAKEVRVAGENPPGDFRATAVLIHDVVGHPLVLAHRDLPDEHLDRQSVRSRAAAQLRDVVQSEDLRDRLQETAHMDQLSQMDYRKRVATLTRDVFRELGVTTQCGLAKGGVKVNILDRPIGSKESEILGWIQEVSELTVVSAEVGRVEPAIEPQSIEHDL